MSGPLTFDVPANAACKGQVHFALASIAPDDVMLLGMCANYAAAVLFEKLQAQGTNIIITLGKETRADVLARYENDGLELLWSPKQTDETQLAAVQERIKAKTFFVQHKQERPEPARPAAPEAPRHLTEDEEDMLVRQLHRIP